MTPSRPMHFKQIIDFIHTNNKHYNAKELRKLYRKDISKFIRLLDDAVKAAGVVPAVAKPFYKEISQINKLTQTKEAIMNNQSNQQNQNNHEKSTSETKRKTIYFIVVEKVVSMYNSVKSFLSGNIDKFKAIGATLVAVAVAYLARAHSGMFVALAALKGSGTMDNLKGLGMTMFSKAVDIKDAIIDRSISAVSWVKGLFTSNTATHAA